MIHSMTGFARREVQSAQGELSCELRSVNHRYLEAGFRLPEELRGLEGELRRTAAAALRRGKVDCSIHLRGVPLGARDLQVDDEALRRLLLRAKEIAAVAPSAPTFDVLDALRWPGVLRDQPVDDEGLAADCRALFEATLSELVAMRAREGERLRELLEQRCEALAKLVATMRARLPELRSRLRQRLHERVAEYAASVDAERMAQELALLLQKADVDEEIDRLDGHIAEIRRVIAGDEAAGRRLDFLMQELNREANTLSSKSQELDTTRLAVDMKVLIEQMREQVQNVE